MDDINQTSARAVKLFTNDFISVFNRDKSYAVSMLISTFVNCYAMMEEAERFRTMVGLIDIVGEISSEKFEDGTDFVSFLKEKVIERGGEL